MVCKNKLITQFVRLLLMNLSMCDSQREGAFREVSIKNGKYFKIKRYSKNLRPYPANFHVTNRSLNMKFHASVGIRANNLEF